MAPTGHIAIAFFSKKYAMKLNIFLLFFAAYFIDLVYFMSDAAGGEVAGIVSYSHSFVLAIIFSLLFYAVSWLLTHNHISSYVLGAVVFSHWVLDLIVWDNLAWLPRSPQVLGLGLYTLLGVDTANAQLNFATIFAALLELLMLGAGIWIFIKAKKRWRTAYKLA